MSTTLEELLARYVYTQLQDSERNLRWTRDELTQYVNFALRDIVARRPEAGAVTNRAMTLREGIRQLLPANAIRLKEVVRNVESLIAAVLSQQNADQYVDVLAVLGLSASVGLTKSWDDMVSIVATIVGNIIAVGDVSQIGQRTSAGPMRSGSFGTQTIQISASIAYVGSQNSTSTDVVIRDRSLATLRRKPAARPAGLQSRNVVFTPKGDKLYAGVFNDRELLFVQHGSDRPNTASNDPSPADGRGCLLQYDVAGDTSVSDITSVGGGATGTHGCYAAVSPDGTKLAVVRCPQIGDTSAPTKLVTVVDAQTLAEISSAAPGGGVMGSIITRERVNWEYYDGASWTFLQPTNLPTYVYSAEPVFSPLGSYLFLVGHGARRFRRVSEYVVGQQYSAASVGRHNSKSEYQYDGPSPGNIQVLNALSGSIVDSAVDMNGVELDIFWMAQIPWTTRYIAVGRKWFSSGAWGTTQYVTAFQYVSGRLVNEGWEVNTRPNVQDTPSVSATNFLSVVPQMYNQPNTLSANGRYAVLADVLFDLHTDSGIPSAEHAFAVDTGYPLAAGVSTTRGPFDDKGPAMYAFTGNDTHLVVRTLFGTPVKYYGVGLFTRASGYYETSRIVSAADVDIDNVVELHSVVMDAAPFPGGYIT